MIEDKPRILVVQSDYVPAVGKALLASAMAALDAVGADTDAIEVPGALEIPAAVAMAEEGGARSVGVKYDGYVAIGCVLHDIGRHWPVLANTCAYGLMDLAIGRRLAIGQAVLSVPDEAAGLAQAQTAGAAAAQTCLEMIKLRKRLLGKAR